MTYVESSAQYLECGDNPAECAQPHFVAWCTSWCCVKSEVVKRQAPSGRPSTFKVVHSSLLVAPH